MAVNFSKTHLMLSPNQIQRLLESSFSFIRQYSVMMILSPDVSSNAVFSGTFVSCFGYLGILTAGHCATTVMENREFYLVIREDAHRFEVQPSQFFHLRVGYDESEGYALSQPDLSFLIITERRILNMLIANSRFFYEMSKLKIEDTGLVDRKFNGNNWIITGSATEDTKTRTLMIKGQEEKFITLGASVFKANFADHDLVSDYGFDYIKLRVVSDSRGFPDNYNGVSGGGVWYLKFTKTATGSEVFKPLLVGVACWQSQKKLSPELTERIISGHGWVSVYGHFRKALFEKFKTDPPQIRDRLRLNFL
jgi:hypothetical protein